jgi:hypothetical protein
MNALPIVRFRLQTSDGSRWWRADCDWTQPAPNLLRLSVEAIVLTDSDSRVWTVAQVAEAAGLSVEAIVYTMRRALGIVAADRMRDGTKLPRVTLPRGSRPVVIEGRLAS